MLVYGTEQLIVATLCAVCIRYRRLLLLMLRGKGLNSMLDEFLSFFSPSDGVCEAVAGTPILPATQFATGALPSDITAPAGPGRAGTGTAEIYLV